MNHKFLNIVHFISLLFIFCTCSNNNSKEYSLDNLSNPLLDEWFANFKAADDSFSADRFKPLFYSAVPEIYPKKWYDYEPDTACWLIFSPNRNFYLDLDFYSGIDDAIERGVYAGGDVDAKTVLVNVRNKEAIDIIKTNCCNDAIDAFWVNDSVFVLLGQSFDMSSEEWSPYISVWNREKEISVYIYDGKINNFRDDNFSPFFKRLQRLGIKVEED
jgi:hypothetical protein